jgi:PKD repeat protein
VPHAASPAAVRICLVLAPFLLFGCGGGEALLLPGDGEPAAITVLSGSEQQGRVGERLKNPVVVRVTDSQGRSLEGAQVVFQFTSDAPEADFVPDTARTNSLGQANAQIVLGTRMGTQTGEARVVVPDGSREPKATFTAIALSENANEMAMFSGNEQTGPAGAPLGQPLVVQVTDAFGNPISGVPIAWAIEGGGSVSQTSVNTDDQGLASVSRTQGPAAGPQTTTASSQGLAGSPVIFTHTATAGSAAGLTIVSGNNQTAVVGTQLPADLVVQLTDAEGNGVPGTAVTWVASTGGGSVTPENGMTDEAGRASAQWTLGPNPGQNRLDAVVSGVGVASFTAVGTSGAPPALSIVTQPSGSARNGVPLERQPVVQAAGPGVEITAQLSGGGGEVTGTTHRLTDASGRATFTDLAISGAEGRRILVFTASGYSGASSNEIDVHAVSTTTTITSDSPDPSVSQAPFTVGFRVASEGPTPTGTVTVTVDDGNATCSAALNNGEGSCQMALGRTGNRTLRATYSGAPGLNGSSDTEGHTVTETPPPPNQAPTAGFTSSCSGLTCTFDDASTDSDGRIAQRVWAFGDGNTSDARNPRNTYSAAGTYQVMLTVTDDDGASDSETQSVTVSPPAPQNEEPFADFNWHCEDLTCHFTDKSKDEDGNETIVSRSWNLGDGTIILNQLDFSHTYENAGDYHVVLTVTDNAGASDDSSDDLHVSAPPAPNRAPTAQSDGPYSTKEGANFTLHVPAPGLLGNDSDPDGDNLTAVLVDNASHGDAIVHEDGSFDYTPVAAFYGDDSFTYRVTDGHGGSSGEATVSITVLPVNDSPRFTDAGDVTALQDAPAQTISNWATNISPGAPNETDQTLTFIVTQNDNPSLFAEGPAITRDGGGDTGTLTFTPAPGVSGSAKITIVLQDNGGTDNGGFDTSQPHEFTITVESGGGGGGTSGEED